MFLFYFIFFFPYSKIEFISYFIFFFLQDDGNNVNARGPLGMTPLMVVAVRGGGIDTGDADCEDDGTAQKIADLVAQGAQLNATMDKTGKFFLTKLFIEIFFNDL